MEVYICQKNVLYMILHKPNLHNETVNTIRCMCESMFEEIKRIYGDPVVMNMNWFGQGQTLCYSRTY